MTGRPGVGAGLGMPRLWVVPLGMIAGVSFAALTGVVTKAVFLDMVAWWPVWLGLVGVGVALRSRANGRVRPGGVVALLAAIVCGVFLVGHVAGWGLMPSAGQRLVGPELGDVEVASLDAVIHGRLVVGSGADFLYVVHPVRWGGQFGVPRAIEEVTNPETVHVTLANPADPGLLAYAGWDIALAVGPIWELDLGGAISADLSGLRVIGLVLAGSGEVVLGDVDFRGDVFVDGAFRLDFPIGSAVLVVGEAVVPDGWIVVDGGWRSPVEGDGWTLSVAPGASVEIVTR